MFIAGCRLTSVSWIILISPCPGKTAATASETCRPALHRRDMARKTGKAGATGNGGSAFEHAEGRYVQGDELMRKRFFILLAFGVCLALAGCNSAKPPASPAPGTAAESSAPRIYVTNEVSGDLSVIDTRTRKVIATVPLGKRPRGIHASPDQKTLYVALSGSPIAGPDVDESTLPPPDKSADGIGVFSVAQNKMVRVLPGGSDPENFDVSKDGKQLLISNEDTSAVSIVDIASGTVLKTIKIGGQPEGVRVAPDGKRVFITSEEDGTITVLDLAAGHIISTFKVGRRPRSIAFMPDGSRAYVNAENDGTVVLVDAVKFKTLKTIPLGKPGVIKPMAVLLSPDATRLYVSTGRGQQVFTVDTATQTVLGSVTVGKRPWGIALSPDAKTLYSANGPSNNISVVNLADNTVAATIPAGTGPWGVIVLPPLR